MPVAQAPDVKIPLVDLSPQHAEIADHALAAIGDVVKSGGFILGEHVVRFEQTLAGMCGVAHAVGVASGTDALVLALRACGVSEGELVLTTPLTFAATAEAIVRAGGRPVFCDVDAETLNLSPEAVRARIGELDSSSRAKLRALLPVHLFGRACDMDALFGIAREYGLVVVEDAAQALGARVAGRAVGGMGAAGCLSFFPSKNLGAWGDGGAVVTDDERVAERVRRLRAHGVEGGRHVEVGCNSRLDALQAAVLEVKAARLGDWTRARIAAAARYSALLAPLAPHLRVPLPGPAGTHVFHQYVVLARRRDDLAAHLAEKEIESRAYYSTPLHAQPCFANRHAPRVPVAESAAREILALPFFYGITVEQQTTVCRAIAAFYEG